MYLAQEDKSNLVEELLVLSWGPTPYVESFSGFIVNGYKFHTIDYGKIWLSYQIKIKKLEIYAKIKYHFLKITCKFINIENVTLYLSHIKNAIFSKNREKLSFREKLTFLLRIFFKYS